MALVATTFAFKFVVGLSGPRGKAHGENNIRRGYPSSSRTGPDTMAFLSIPRILDPGLGNSKMICYSR